MYKMFEVDNTAIIYYLNNASHLAGCIDQHRNVVKELGSMKISNAYLKSIFKKIIIKFPQPAASNTIFYTSNNSSCLEGTKIRSFDV